MKKGFVHIIETVLVSLMAIVAIMYLLYPVNPEIGWERAGLTTTGEDLLAVLSDDYLKDIMEKGREEIGSKVSDILTGEKISFNMKSVGAYKNEIRVGCNCSEKEASELRKILTPAYVNNRKIKFTVYPFKFEDLTTEKWVDYDVIFLNEDDQVSTAKNYVGDIKSFLGRGRGIVEFVDFDSSGEIGDLQREIFGLRQDGGDGGDVEFTNREDPEKPNYGIGKLFYGTDSSVEFADGGAGGEKTGYWTIWNISHKVKTYKSNSVFDRVNVSNDTDEDYEYAGLKEGDEFNIKHDGDYYYFDVERIESDGRRAWFNHLGNYKFENSNDEITSPAEIKISPINGQDNIVAETTGGRAVVTVNASEGKAVWISKAGGDDIKGLVKASTIWSAGKDWWNLLRTTNNERVKVEYFVSQGEEIYEPYNIELSLWYLY